MMNRETESNSGTNLRIWDRPTVLVNWLMILSFLFSYMTVSAPTYGFFLHIVFISVLFVGLVFRTFWGVFGARTVRFTEMLTSPAAMLAQMNDLINFRRETWIGHSPLSGFFSLVLFTMLWICVVSGLFSVGQAGEQTWLLQKIFGGGLFGSNFGTQEFHQNIMGYTAIYMTAYAMVAAFFVVYDGGSVRNFIFNGQIRVSQMIHPSRVPLQPRVAGVGILAAGLVCSLFAIMLVPSVQDLRAQFRPDEIATAPQMASDISAEDLATIAPAAGTVTQDATRNSVGNSGISHVNRTSPEDEAMQFQFQIDPETGQLRVQ